MIIKYRNKKKLDLGMLDKIKSNVEFDRQAEGVYFNYILIREAIKGLIDILEIRLSADDFFYQAGIQNLRAVHDSIIDILKVL